MRASLVALKEDHPRARWLKPPGPVATGLRIGLLGGSFNPAHEGHLHVSDVALKRLGLDYVWWLVAPQNPLKAVRGMAPMRDRMATARAMTRHRPRLRITGIEADMGTRYTIDTVAGLKKRFPQVRFVWLMGSDNLATFHLWRRWQELAGCIPIAIVMRPGTTLASLKAKAAQYFARTKPRGARNFAYGEPPAFLVLEARRIPASASAIRARALGPPDRGV